MNQQQVDLLLKVKRHILRKPTRLRMSNWIVKGKSGTIYSSNSSWGEYESKIPSCGTIGCIAGWTVLLARPEVVEQKEKLPFSTVFQNNEEFKFPTIRNEAVELLGLCDQDAGKLFVVTGWPKELCNTYISATTQTQRAKIVGQVIDDFIEKHKDADVVVVKRVKKELVLK